MNKLTLVFCVFFLITSCKKNIEVIKDSKTYFNKRGFLIGTNQSKIEESAKQFALIYECDQDAVPYMKDSTFCIASDQDSISINFYFLNNILVQRVSAHKFKDSVSIENFLADFKSLEKFHNKEKRIVINEKNTQNILEVFKLKDHYEIWYNSKLTTNI